MGVMKCYYERTDIRDFAPLVEGVLSAFPELELIDVDPGDRFLNVLYRPVTSLGDAIRFFNERKEYKVRHNVTYRGQVPINTINGIDKRDFTLTFMPDWPEHPHSDEYSYINILCTDLEESFYSYRSETNARKNCDLMVAGAKAIIESTSPLCIYFGSCTGVTFYLNNDGFGSFEYFKNPRDYARNCFNMLRKYGSTFHFQERYHNKKLLDSNIVKKDDFLSHFKPLTRKRRKPIEKLIARIEPDTILSLAKDAVSQVTGAEVTEFNEGFGIRGSSGFLAKKIFVNMFNWNNVPGTDERRLRDFLKHNLCVDWAEKAHIRRIDGGKAVTASSGDNWVELRFTKDGKALSLKTSDGRRRELIPKEERGKLNIYGNLSSFTESNDSATALFYLSLAELMLEEVSK